MIVISESMCSEEFKAAYKALREGASIRRASWASGTFLLKNGDRINVYRLDQFAAPDWHPSSSELQATNWGLA
ncbi:Thoeris anti-defense Tad2 family protein [Duganella vulcania]|uniref:Thoeris anti-defense 2-like domain-containing protein n=1 Tax=Duganella vulcania TaxID=2692166 RepID=A0A845GE65_9BURK|nr:hypothetical protein [Duganella vulcania]MYM92584.1 hypothetical protein [Duganella vulcania]